MVHLVSGIGDGVFQSIFRRFLTKGHEGWKGRRALQDTTLAQVFGLSKVYLGFGNWDAIFDIWDVAFGIWDGELDIDIWDAVFTLSLPREPLQTLDTRLRYVDNNSILLFKCNRIS